MLVVRVFNWRYDKHMFVYSDDPFVYCYSIILTKEEIWLLN